MLANAEDMAAAQDASTADLRRRIDQARSAPDLATWLGPGPAPFTCQPCVRIGGVGYRLAPKPDMTAAEAFWLLMFRERMGPRVLDGTDCFDPASVLAWLAEKNLLRHLEPEEA